VAVLGRVCDGFRNCPVQIVPRHSYSAKFCVIIIIIIIDRLCGLVVTVLGYRSRGPSSIPGTTRKKNSSGLERVPLSLVSTTEELLNRKVAAPV
jgi:hypothetical protein